MLVIMDCLLWVLEYPCILMQKVKEKIGFKDFMFNVSWKLYPNIFKLFVVVNHILIIFPFIHKESFNSLLDFLFERNISVVILINKGEESLQLGILFVFRILVLDDINHLDEVTHDVGEQGNSEKHEESDEDSFDVTLGVIVTKAHSRKSGEGVVSKNDNVFRFRFVMHVETVDKETGCIIALMTFVFKGMILHCEDGSVQHTKEEGRTEDHEE